MARALVLSKVVALIVLVLAFGSGSKVVHAQALDTQNAFFAAFNAGDIPTLESMMTSDFVITNNANCTSPCNGRAEAVFLVAINLKLTVDSAQEANNVVRSRVTATSALFEQVAPGVTRVFANTTLTVRDGRVASLDIQLDISDPQSAALATAFRATRGADAAGPLGVQTRFAEALNGGSMTTLRNLITSDFVVRGNAGCLQPCAGDPLMQFYISVNLRVNVLSAQVSGNNVVSQVVVTSPLLETIVPGVDRVRAETNLTVRDGRVSALTIQLDLSDSLSALVAERLSAAQFAAAAVISASAPTAAAAIPAALPAAGGGAETGHQAWLFGVAAVLLLLGATSLTVSLVGGRTRVR